MLVEFLLPIDRKLFDMGKQIGKIYTDFGLPIDMGIDHLVQSNHIANDKYQKAQVLFGAQSWLIEHRRNSNATDKALDRQRRANMTAMYSFLKTGESGIY
jgi:hypothetical protein